MSTRQCDKSRSYQCLLEVLLVPLALRHRVPKLMALRGVLETLMDHITNWPAILILDYESRVVG